MNDRHSVQHSAAHALTADGEAPGYTCPMHPEVRQNHPGSCPKCGMALEPVAPAPTAAKTEYVCPMHPEIVRSEPGNCPICGMTLEPRVASAEEGESAELADMTRRFWVSVALALPLLFLAMSEIIPGQPVQRGITVSLRTWIELALATPAVLWAGWPLFGRGHRPPQPQHVHANSDGRRRCLHVQLVCGDIPRRVPRILSRA